MIESIVTDAVGSALAAVWCVVLRHAYERHPAARELHAFSRTTKEWKDSFSNPYPKIVPGSGWTVRVM